MQDDPGNLCHAGFLSSARSMIKPVAARLRQLLKDRPGRSNYSLLITGHSAGGAVAALLYSHMHSASRAAQSELSVLAGSFKRIHCVTFGTPPVSLLPLAKPESSSFRKSVFMAFVNEGDPVARADKAYVRSLIELLAAPDPKGKPPESSKAVRKEKSKLTLSSKKAPSKPPNAISKWDARSPTWRVPNCTLSLAGRVVVLRTRERAGLADRRTVEDRMRHGVVAQTASDGDVRGVIWGDPVCHVMRFYSRRVEALAVEAITATR
ncbi:lipase family protein [Candidatus Bathyarchaeota archaeon]|nr:lipase family protein [Candidatus Bathyarchaeota archaeon]